MRKAWDDDLDQRLISEAQRRGIGPYELIAEAIRSYLPS
ncbi:CopG family transcriptional regulator [Streptomyces sp. NPDC001930]